MKGKVRGYTVFFVLLPLFLMVIPGCASSKKDTYMKDKAKAQSQYINTTQLGRNKYYFSPKYQKKLNKYKKK